MNYQAYDSANDTDAATWTAAPASTHMVPAARNGQLTPAAPNMSEMLMLGSLIQSLQQTQTQQLYMLRELDARLARVENNARPQAAATPSFERATWWAIWGLLMLILGGALAVVMALILLNIEFR